MINQNSLSSNKLLLTAIHGSIALLVLIGVKSLQYFYPTVFTYLIIEDSWVEYGTFVCYILAAGLLMWAIKSDRSLLKFGYVMMVLAFFMIAMEEISWGQRLFHIKTPEALARLNVQSELNLHNMDRDIPIGTFDIIFFNAVTIWVFVISPLAVRFKLLRERLVKLGVPIVPIHLICYFALSLFIAFIQRLVSDEVGELILSFAFFCLVIDIWMKARNHGVVAKIPVIVVTGLVTAVAVAITGIFVSIGLESKSVRWGFRKMATKGYPKYGLYEQADQLFRYILNNPKLKVSDTRLEYGIFLKKINSPRAQGILTLALTEQYQLIKEKPDKSEFYYAAGKILKLLGNKELAQQEFQNSLNRDQLNLSQAKTGEEKSLILSSIGKTYFEMEDLAAALGYFKEADHLTTNKREKIRLQQWIEKTSASPQNFFGVTVKNLGQGLE